MRPRCLLLNIPNLSLDVLNNENSRANFPALTSLMSGGVLREFRNIESSIIFEGIISTGRPPFESRFACYEAPRQDGLGSIKLQRHSINTPLIWELLDSQAIRCASIGMLSTHQSRLSHGIVVSDHFTAGFGDDYQDWPIPLGSVHPTGYLPRFGELRWHPYILSEDILENFTGSDDSFPEPTRQEAMRMLCESGTYHAIATDILENESVDFLCVRYPLLSRLDQLFGEDASAWAKAMVTGTQLIEAYLSRILEIEAVTDIIISGGPKNRPFVIYDGEGFDNNGDSWGYSPYDISASILSVYKLRCDEIDGSPPPHLKNSSLRGIEYLPERKNREGSSLKSFVLSKYPSAVKPTQLQINESDTAEFKRNFAIASYCIRNNESYYAAQFLSECKKLRPDDVVVNQLMRSVE